MIRKSGSPLPVGSVSSQLASAIAAFFRVMLQLPWPSPVSGSPKALQSDPFDLRWFTTTVNRPPLAFSLNVWASAGRFSVSMNSGSSAEVNVCVRADRGHRRRLVDERHPDLRRCR